MNAVTFEVKTEVFEGPLELLLDMVEERKLFVNDVALAAVAEDYIAHVENLPELPMRDTAQFVLIASTLLLIKSKSLLPGIVLTEEESEDIKELERRLALYTRVRELTRGVRSKYGSIALYARPLDRGDREPVFTPHASLTLSALANAVHGLIHSLPKPETLTKAVVDKVMSLEEMIETLTDRIKTNLSMRFSDLTKKTPQTREEKVEVIVGFLALLELVKRGVVHVRQGTLFDDIDIESEDVSVPDYR